MPAQTTIQVRRGTASSWTSTNPTLAAGEVGFETDTGKFKIGTGSTVWTGLAYSSILPNTVTTKGDLLAATGSATVDRLAAGANGYTLVADSSTSTGLAYAGTEIVNPVLNSAMQIWQRGTSISASASSNIYTADRWGFGCGANQASTISRQSTNDTTNLPFIQYCARVQRNSGQTGASNDMIFVQSFESVNSIPFAGKTVTLSFYARAGANFSSTSNRLGVYLITGTGTDQNRNGVAYTGEAYAINNQTATLTTTWQRFIYTGTISSTATEMSTYFYFTPTGTAGTSDYFEITGVQIDLGSTALPFRTNGNTLQEELAACQRYYYRTSGTAAYYAMAQGVSSSTTAANALFQWPVTLRVASTDITYGNLYFEQYNGTAGLNPTVTAANASNNVARLSLTGMTGLTAGQVGYLFSYNSSTSYIAVNAEL